MGIFYSKQHDDENCLRIEDLPVEIMVEIFSNLSKTEKMKVSMVNRRWFGIANNEIQSLKIKSQEQTKDSIQQAFEAQHNIDKNVLRTIFDDIGPVIKTPPTSVPSAKFTPLVTPVGSATVSPLPMPSVITIFDTVNETHEIEDQTKQFDFNLDCAGQISTRSCIQDNFNIFFEEIYNKACVKDQHCSAVSYCSRKLISVLILIQFCINEYD